MSVQFNTLPPELLLSIFTFLDAPSVARAGKVCRLWKDIANQALLWNRLCERDWPQFANKYNSRLNAAPHYKYICCLHETKGSIHQAQENFEKINTPDQLRPIRLPVPRSPLLLARKEQERSKTLVQIMIPVVEAAIQLHRNGFKAELTQVKQAAQILSKEHLQSTCLREIEAYETSASQTPITNKVEYVHPTLAS